MDADSVAGCLLGLAVGDALGLPREGLSRSRAARLFPRPDRHHFLFRRGLFSDDTEHAALTAQALLASGGDVGRFTARLARGLRWWVLGLPVGAGRATLRACGRLWLGFGPAKSGVWSAGNGPAMRAPVLGVALGDDPERLGAFVRASTVLTHTDPKAEYGAFAVAWAAWRSAQSRGNPPLAARWFVDDLRSFIKGDKASAPLLEVLDALVLSVEGGQTTEEFADALDLGRGVTGFMYHTVPMVLHAWLRHPDDYAAAVQTVIRCGGDTDTTAALAGAVVGARVGMGGIPVGWRDRVIDWPRSLGWLERLAWRLADGKWKADPQRPLRLAVWAIPFRNAVFLAAVLAHVARRMLPPY